MKWETVNGEFVICTDNTFSVIGRSPPYRHGERMKGSGSLLRSSGILCRVPRRMVSKLSRELTGLFLRVENVRWRMTEQAEASGSYNVALGKMCAHAFVEKRVSSLECYVTRSTTVTCLKRGHRVTEKRGESHKVTSWSTLFPYRSGKLVMWNNRLLFFWTKN
jgi:hypothetical protein